MGQVSQVRKKLHYLLLVEVGPGHDSPGRFGVAGVGNDVRYVGRDVEEIRRAHLDPLLQLLTEPQHRPSLENVDRGFMCGVAMGPCSPVGRDRKNVGT